MLSDHLPDSMIWLKKCFESENAKNAVFRSKKLNYAAFK